MSNSSIRAVVRALRALAVLAVFPTGLVAQDAMAEAEPTAWSSIPAAMQIQLAVQAAPPAMREAAVVQGYDADGTFVTLRDGEGEMICMAPNPASERFEVSCHHRDLEPFFERGRELVSEGITGNERTLARWAEVDAGTLPLPAGRTNHILTGSGFDPETGEIVDAFTRWVVYMPGKTGAELGLSEQPAGPGVPWVMFPGTAGAHIMITPPRGG